MEARNEDPGSWLHAIEQWMERRSAPKEVLAAAGMLRSLLERGNMVGLGRVRYEVRRPPLDEIRDYVDRTDAAIAAGQFEQRRSQERDVVMRALDIGEERWVLNFEPILVTAGGLIIDGLHRLRAALRVGKSFESLWVFGVSDGIYRSLGCNRPRKAAEAAATLLGELPYNQMRIATSGARVAMSIDDDGACSHYRCERHSNKAITDYLESNPGYVAFVKNMLEIGPCPVSPGMMLGIAWRVRSEFPEAVERFFRPLLTREGLDVGSPMSVLLRAAADRRSGLDGSTSRRWAAIANTWNAWVMGDSMKLVRFKAYQEVRLIVKRPPTPSINTAA